MNASAGSGLGGPFLSPLLPLLASSLLSWVTPSPSLLCLCLCLCTSLSISVCFSVFFCVFPLLLSGPSCLVLFSALFCASRLVTESLCQQASWALAPSVCTSSGAWRRAGDARGWGCTVFVQGPRELLRCSCAGPTGLVPWVRVRMCGRCMRGGGRPRAGFRVRACGPWGPPGGTLPPQLRSLGGVISRYFVVFS